MHLRKSETRKNHFLMSSPKQRKCCEQYCVKNLSPGKTKALKMQDVANINW